MRKWSDHRLFGKIFETDNENVAPRTARRLGNTTRQRAAPREDS
jgi:hypothetical protein